MLPRVRPLIASLFFVTVIACSKKQPPPPVAQDNAPAPAASPTAAATPSASVTAAASTAAVEEAIEGEFLAVESFALPEGKVLPIPKLTPASKDDVKAHAGVLQTEFEAIVKEGYKEQNRFNASFIPATYILMMKPGKQGTQMTENEPELWTMLVVERDSVTRQPVASLRGPTDDKGSTGAFALVSTARGWFVDAYGDGTVEYVIRRRGEPFGGANDPSKRDVWECEGKRVDLDSHGVTSVDAPDYPGRGKDLDGDGKNEFPTQRFSFALTPFAWSTPPSVDGVCNLPASGVVTLAVLGATSMLTEWKEASPEMAAFYERRAKATKKRVEKIRAWAGADPKPVTRKSGELRFTNECALDVAQAAAETFVYAVTLGKNPTLAIDEADAVMKGFALKPLACSGIVRRTEPSIAKPEDGHDYWPDVRKALLAATINVVGGPKPEPAPSASAVPSASASH